MIDTKELRDRAATFGSDYLTDEEWVEVIDRLEAAEKERDALRADKATLQQMTYYLKDRLEAAEKSDAESIAMYHKAGDERDALRAKIAEMEKQEPVAHVWRCDNGHIHGSSERFLPMGTKLYALPGAQAQPAPSVPTSLLVAIADLVTQMEIIARVGFVDTPDDKDSCAAFCVAEGAWLELMSCVESLAASLAEAPETKP